MTSTADGIDYLADDDVLGDSLLKYMSDEESTSTEMPTEMTMVTESNDDTARFLKQLTDYEISETIKHQENKNPRQNTGWAFKVFQKWQKVRTGVPSQD